jgi:hypothetical protein
VNEENIHAHESCIRKCFKKGDDVSDVILKIVFDEAEQQT